VAEAATHAAAAAAGSAKLQEERLAAVERAVRAEEAAAEATGGGAAAAAAAVSAELSHAKEALQKAEAQNVLYAAQVGCLSRPLDLSHAISRSHSLHSGGYFLTSLNTLSPNLDISHDISRAERRAARTGRRLQN